MSEIKDWLRDRASDHREPNVYGKALAEIERLEADRDNWVESSQANRAERDALRAQVAGMEAALRQGAAWFREYEAGHRLKGDDDKAARNGNRANHLEDALSTPPAETETDEARELRRANALYDDTELGWNACQEAARIIAESDRAAKGAK